LVNPYHNYDPAQDEPADVFVNDEDYSDEDLIIQAMFMRQEL